MKVYVITDSDINRLILAVDRNPQHGKLGGSSRGTPTPEQLKAEGEAHDFFNFQVRRWLKEVTDGDRTCKGG
jgi:hypothetical protein